MRQKDLAEAMGFEQSYVSALELGIKGPPSRDFVDRLAKYLRLSADELAGLLSELEASRRHYTIPQTASSDAYCSGQLIPDTALSFSSATVHASTPERVKLTWTSRPFCRMRENNRECAMARDLINKKCFAGGAANHRNEALEAWANVAKCEGLLK